MAAIATLLRLALAAGLSGAASGLLLGLAIFFGGRLGEPGFGAASAGLAELWSLAAFGITMGVFAASVPAFFAGAALWGLSRYRRAAGQPLAWAGAGAAAGALLLALIELSFWTPGRADRLTYLDAVFLLVFLIAGTGGSLTFRATMRFTAFMDE